jgi:hypothetical protein
MKSWIERVIKWGTYFLVCLTPILYFGPGFFGPYTTSKTFFFYGAVEVIFTLWFYLILVESKYRLPKRVLFYFTALFIFLAWLTIAGIFGVRPEVSFWSSLSRGTGLITLYHGLLLTVVISSLINTQGLLTYGKTLLNFFLTGSFILALSVWFGNEGLNLPLEFLQKSKGGGLIGNSSLAATYLTFSIFLGLFALFVPGTSYRLKAWLGVVLLTILSSPLFLSFSARAATLGVLVGLSMGVLSYFLLSKRSVIKYTSLIIILVFMSLSVFTWKSFVTVNTTLHQKFIESTTGIVLFFGKLLKRV